MLGDDPFVWLSGAYVDSSGGEAKEETGDDMLGYDPFVWFSSADADSSGGEAKEEMCKVSVMGRVHIKGLSGFVRITGGGFSGALSYQRESSEVIQEGSPVPIAVVVATCGPREAVLFTEGDGESEVAGTLYVPTRLIGQVGEGGKIGIYAKLDMAMGQRSDGRVCFTHGPDVRVNLIIIKAEDGSRMHDAYRWLDINYGMINGAGEMIGAAGPHVETCIVPLGNGKPTIFMLSPGTAPPGGSMLMLGPSMGALRYDDKAFRWRLDAWLRARVVPIPVSQSGGQGASTGESISKMDERLLSMWAFGPDSEAPGGWDVICACNYEDEKGARWGLKTMTGVLFTGKSLQPGEVMMQLQTKLGGNVLGGHSDVSAHIGYMFSGNGTITVLSSDGIRLELSCYVDTPLFSRVCMPPPRVSISSSREDYASILLIGKVKCLISESDEDKTATIEANSLAIFHVDTSRTTSLGSGSQTGATSGNAYLTGSFGLGSEGTTEQLMVMYCWVPKAFPIAAREDGRLRTASLRCTERLELTPPVCDDRVVGMSGDMQLTFGDERHTINLGVVPGFPDIMPKEEQAVSRELEYMECEQHGKVELVTRIFHPGYVSR